MFKASGGNGRAPILVAQSFALNTRTSVNAAGDTAEQPHASIVMPGGTMNLNGRLVITADWTMTAAASPTKTLTVYFGGSQLSSITTASNSVALEAVCDIKNLGSLSSQKAFNSSIAGLSANAFVSSSVNTANDVTIELRSKWSAAILSDTINLIGYTILYIPGV